MFCVLLKYHKKFRKSNSSVFYKLIEIIFQHKPQCFHQTLFKILFIVAVLDSIKKANVQNSYTIQILNT